MEQCWNSSDGGKITSTISFTTHFTYAAKEPVPTGSINGASGHSGQSSKQYVLRAPYTFSSTVHFSSVKKTARKTGLNVFWHSTGFPLGLSVPWDDAIVVSAGKPRKLWDYLSELRSSVCERRLEKTVLRPPLSPVKTAQLLNFSVRYDVTQ
jgi:hypothetical protein